jgi:hypothetical protein
MYRYQNRSVHYQNKKYEIFWVTEFVVHINKRSAHHSHLIEIEDVEELALSAKYYPYKGNLYVGLAKFNSRFYSIFCYFVDVNRRLVIKTCCQVNDPKLLKLSQEIL